MYYKNGKQTKITDKNISTKITNCNTCTNSLCVCCGLTGKIHVTYVFFCCKYIFFVVDIPFL